MRPSIALALPLLLAGVAQAQDVTGTWHGAKGNLEISQADEDYSVLGGDYDIHASFADKTLTLTRTITPGMTGALDHTGSSGIETTNLHYSSGTYYDWLDGKGVSFYRIREPDTGLNGPWWTDPKPPELTNERIDALYDDLCDIDFNRNFAVDDPHDASLDEAGKLGKVEAFRQQKEAEWGEPVTKLEAKDFPNAGIFEAFRTQKAIVLTRYGRKPSEVEDAFIDVSGSVDGVTINPRHIFTQRWKATNSVDAKVIGAVFPGYLDDGRIFLQQVQLANQAGADMVTMDAQWTGYTTGGHEGGVDSGQGIARDTYGFAAYVGHAFAGKKLFVMGSSLGGGPGTIGMLTFARANAISATVKSGDKTWEGTDLVPANTPAIAQAPFLHITPNFSNELDRFLGHVPILRTHEFHTELKTKGLDTLHVIKDLDTREEASPSVAEAMPATLHFDNEIVERVKNGLGPEGPLYVVHSKNDTLAYYPTASAVVEILQTQGVDAEITTLDSNHHMIWLDPTEQKAFLPYLAKIMGQ
jgi:hypothetical protein